MVRTAKEPAKKTTVSKAQAKEPQEAQEAEIAPRTDEIAAPKAEEEINDFASRADRCPLYPGDVSRLVVAPRRIDAAALVYDEGASSWDGGHSRDCESHIAVTTAGIVMDNAGQRSCAEHVAQLREAIYRGVLIERRHVERRLRRISRDRRAGKVRKALAHVYGARSGAELVQFCPEGARGTEAHAEACCCGSAQRSRCCAQQRSHGSNIIAALQWVPAGSGPQPLAAMAHVDSFGSTAKCSTTASSHNPLRRLGPQVHTRPSHLPG